uniref:Ribos_L4_asso_C domain-containing protein n=1 Tax=Macrostomum lignano TaxID=282301 RepID=A0A1I8HA19_9PLAT
PAGHRIEKISEVPLVVSDSVQDLKKTKEAVAFLKRVKAWPDIQKVYASQRFRAGRGKMRNRARIQKRGPLVIYAKDNGLCRAFRNIPGVTLICVSRLNLLKLAPGGHLGRFVIWSESAFRQLDQIYAKSKLPDNKMASTDLTGILRSDEVKAAVRPRQARQARAVLKKNPLKNVNVMAKLNPYALVLKRKAILAQRKALAKKRKADAPASSQKQQQKKQPAAKKAKQAAVKGKAVKNSAVAKAASPIHRRSHLHGSCRPGPDAASTTTTTTAAAAAASADPTAQASLVQKRRRHLPGENLAVEAGRKQIESVRIFAPAGGAGQPETAAAEVADASGGHSGSGGSGNGRRGAGRCGGVGGGCNGAGDSNIGSAALATAASADAGTDTCWRQQIADAAAAAATAASTGRNVDASGGRDTDGGADASAAAAAAAAAAAEVAQLNVPIVKRQSGNAGIVGMHGQPVDRSVQPDGGEGGGQLAHVPQAQHSVRAAANDSLRTGECGAGDGARVPKAEVAIFAASQSQPPTGMTGHPGDDVLVALVDANQFASLGAPQGHGADPIPGARHHLAAGDEIRTDHGRRVNYISDQYKLSRNKSIPIRQAASPRSPDSTRAGSLITLQGSEPPTEAEAEAGKSWLGSRIRRRMKPNGINRAGVAPILDQTAAVPIVAQPDSRGAVSRAAGHEIPSRESRQAPDAVGLTHNLVKFHSKLRREAAHFAGSAASATAAAPDAGSAARRIQTGSQPFPIQQLLLRHRSPVTVAAAAPSAAALFAGHLQAMANRASMSPVLTQYAQMLDERHHFVSASPDRQQSTVAIESANPNLVSEAHAAPVLQAAVRHFAYKPASFEFGHRGQHSDVIAGNVLGQEAVLNACQEEAVLNACQEEAVLNACQEEAVLNACQEEAVLNACQEEAVLNACQEEAVLNACQEEAVLNACQEEAVLNACQEGAILNEYQEAILNLHQEAILNIHQEAILHVHQKAIFNDHQEAIFNVHQRFSMSTRRRFSKPVKRRFSKPVVSTRFSKPVKRRFSKPVSRRFSKPVKRRFSKPVKRRFSKPVSRRFSKPVKRRFSTPVKRRFLKPVKRRFSKPVKRRFLKPVKRRFSKPVKRRFSKPVSRRFLKPVSRRFSKPVKRRFSKPVRRRFPMPVTHQIVTISPRRSLNRSHIATSCWLADAQTGYQISGNRWPKKLFLQFVRSESSQSRGCHVALYADRHGHAAAVHSAVLFSQSYRGLISCSIIRRRVERIASCSAVNSLSVLGSAEASLPLMGDAGDVHASESLDRHAVQFQIGAQSFTKKAGRKLGRIDSAGEYGLAQKLRLLQHSRQGGFKQSRQRAQTQPQRESNTKPNRRIANWYWRVLQAERSRQSQSLGSASLDDDDVRVGVDEEFAAASSVASAAQPGPVRATRASSRRHSSSRPRSPSPRAERASMPMSMAESHWPSGQRAGCPMPMPNSQILICQASASLESASRRCSTLAQARNTPLGRQSSESQASLTVARQAERARSSLRCTRRTIKSAVSAKRCSSSSSWSSSSRCCCCIWDIMSQTLTDSRASALSRLIRWRVVPARIPELLECRDSVSTKLRPDESTVARHRRLVSAVEVSQAAAAAQRLGSSRANKFKRRDDFELMADAEVKYHSARSGRCIRFWYLRFQCGYATERKQGHRADKAEPNPPSRQAMVSNSPRADRPLLMSLLESEILSISLSSSSSSSETRAALSKASKFCRAASSDCKRKELGPSIQQQLSDPPHRQSINSEQCRH